MKGYLDTHLKFFYVKLLPEYSRDDYALTKQKYVGSLEREQYRLYVAVDLFDEDATVTLLEEFFIGWDTDYVDGFVMENFTAETLDCVTKEWRERMISWYKVQLYDNVILSIDDQPFEDIMNMMSDFSELTDGYPIAIHSKCLTPLEIVKADVTAENPNLTAVPMTEEEFNENFPEESCYDYSNDEVGINAKVDDDADLTAEPIGCYKCAECIKCPNDIPIQAIFQKINHSIGEPLSVLKEVPGIENILNCSKCQTCNRTCNGNLPVMDMINVIKEELKDILKGDN